MVINIIVLFLLIKVVSSIGSCFFTTELITNDIYITSATNYNSVCSSYINLARNIKLCYFLMNEDLLWSYDINGNIVQLLSKNERTEEYSCTLQCYINNTITDT